jgi:hypothetical protein
MVIGALNEYGSLLEAGALIVLDEGKSRVRILPLFKEVLIVRRPTTH